MTEPRFRNSDLESFAEYLGIEGIDSDVFYEMYYQMDDTNDDDYDDAWEKPATEYYCI